MVIVCAAFLARVKAGLDHGEASLHEHHEKPGDQGPHES